MRGKKLLFSPCRSWSQSGIRKTYTGLFHFGTDHRVHLTGIIKIYIRLHPETNRSSNQVAFHLNEQIVLFIDFYCICKIDTVIFLKTVLLVYFTGGLISNRYLQS